MSNEPDSHGKRLETCQATRESVATITIQKIGDLLEIWSKTRIDLSRMS